MSARASRFTRRRLVELGAALVAATLTGDAFADLGSAARAAQASDSTSSTFVTEPSWSAPAMHGRNTPRSGTFARSPLVFVAPTGHNAIFESQTASRGQFGPMILDNSGRPVWFSLTGS